MILCCGEALIDMIPVQADHEGVVFSPIPGGAVFNSAVALGRLGVNTGFYSALSQDRFGKLLEHVLEEAGVDYSQCHRSTLPTSLAFVEFKDGENHYTFYDDGTAGRMLDMNRLPTIGKNVSTLLFGGISLISEPCGSAYEQMLVENAEDKVIFLDPNIRAGFIKDEVAHRQRINRLISYTDVIKVSDEDLAWLEPELSHEEAINVWLNQGVSVVLVTRGAHGADAYKQGRHVQVAAKKTLVVDTVGAGDAFNAGILSDLYERGLLQKNKLENTGIKEFIPALERGNLVASLTVSRKGADAPWARELN